MPLVAATLADELRKFMDDTHGSFIGYPTSELDAASKWAAAVDVYAGVNVVPPSPTASAAKAALEAGLAGMAAPPPLGGAAAMEAGFIAYVLAYGGGLAPALVIVPPIPLSLSAVLVATALTALPPNPPIPPSVQIPIFAAAFDVWFKTQQYVPSAGPPNVFWS